MSKTTITINGEEYIAIPTPKGTFLLFDDFFAPYFAHYLAVNVNNPLDVLVCDFQGEGKACGIKKDNRFSICYYVDDDALEKIKINAKKEPRCDERELVISLYQIFNTNGTPMDYTAIVWFNKKFKEHNITKADFDVFE